LDWNSDLPHIAIIDRIERIAVCSAGEAGVHQPVWVGGSAAESGVQVTFGITQKRELKAELPGVLAVFQERSSVKLLIGR